MLGSTSRNLSPAEALWNSAAPNDALAQGASSASPSQPVSSTSEETVSGGAPSLRNDLNSVAELIANITESYSAVVFLLRSGELAGASAVSGEHSAYLEVAGIHTLSRDFLYNAKIPVGSGIIGWVAETKQRISVFPFEHDSRTLMYYRTNQDLKSFLALPVLATDGRLIGVIACDSKKSYAFPKMAEKLLANCAQQICSLVALHEQVEAVPLVQSAREEKIFAQVVDLIREQPNEQALFSIASDLPEQIIRRDALVVLALSEGGVGEGVFYSKASQTTSGNRLLDIVCKHKRIICGERSVHALGNDDIRKRSFLSVPFHVLGKEAGSFNLLSLPQIPFLPREISAIEALAKVFGRELERLRLRASFSLQSHQLGIASWESFTIQGKLLLREARAQKIGLSLLRFQFPCIREIEEKAGIASAQQFLELAVRLVHQVKRNDAIACAIYGPEILILTSTSEAENTARRFRALLEKSAPGIVESKLANVALRWDRLIREGISAAAALFPHEGETLIELSSKTLQRLSGAEQQGTRSAKDRVEQLEGRAVNAGHR